MASSDDILMESEPEHHGNRNELSNSDQMSLMNTIIDRALERQRKFLIDHIDSKLDTVTRPVPATIEEFDFRQEGNTIQYKFNSQRTEFNNFIDILGYTKTIFSKIVSVFLNCP
jgi:hypothetical protein